MGCIWGADGTLKSEKELESKDLLVGIVPNQSNKGKINPESLEEEKKDTGNQKLPKQREFELEVQWDMFIENIPYRMSITQLKFCCDECKFWQEGSDDKGNYKIEGNFDLSGGINIELVHEKAELNKSFKGQILDNGIEGDWQDPSMGSGKFKLDIVTNVWKTDNASVCLKGTEEPFGIGHFSYGWGVLSGTPGNPKQANVHIYFADGTKGEFECNILEESVYGVVRLPNKPEEQINLPKKNEFI
jgi:hypothetical protein